jgi:hypothetical protein
MFSYFWVYALFFNLSEKSGGCRANFFPHGPGRTCENYSLNEQWHQGTLREV